MSNLGLAVLVPVFDNQIGLEICLRSVAESVGVNLPDVVVVDDGSLFPVQIPRDLNLAVHLIRLDQNQGITRALNMGMEYILEKNYKYVARLDAGDTCLPWRLAKQKEFLDNNPDYGLVSCFAQAVTRDGAKRYVVTSPTSDQGLRRAMHVNNVLLHPTVMMRVELLRQVGLYSDEYPAAEDYELFMRILSQSKGQILEEILVNFEINPEGITLTRKRQQVLSRLRIQVRYFDWGILESYFGLFRSIVAWIVPSVFAEQRKYLVG